MYAGKIRSPLMRSSTSLPKETGAPVSASAARTATPRDHDQRHERDGGEHGQDGRDERREHQPERAEVLEEREHGIADARGGDGRERADRRAARVDRLGSAGAEQDRGER